jgi:hypothetical protein
MRTRWACRALIQAGTYRVPEQHDGGRDTGCGARMTWQRWGARVLTAIPVLGASTTMLRTAVLLAVVLAMASTGNAQSSGWQTDPRYGARPNAYGPGINMDATGRPYTYRDPSGGTSRSASDPTRTGSASAWTSTADRSRRTTDGRGVTMTPGRQGADGGHAALDAGPGGPELATVRAELAAVTGQLAAPRRPRARASPCGGRERTSSAARRTSYPTAGARSCAVGTSSAGRTAGKPNPGTRAVLPCRGQPPEYSKESTIYDEESDNGQPGT